jgi:adenylate kinase
MKYYIIFGPPGAGKGTHSELLVKKYLLLHISTGDVLRREIRDKSDIGLKAKSLMDRGELVDDATVLELIVREISCNGENCRGVILDGYPRNVKQAQALEELLAKAGDKVEAVISLVVDDDIMVQRIHKRAQIENRRDDLDKETIMNRIKTYHTYTEPLIAYYKSKGYYYPVDGSTSIEEGFKNICSIIDSINND